MNEVVSLLVRSLTCSINLYLVELFTALANIITVLLLVSDLRIFLTGSNLAENLWTFYEVDIQLREDLLAEDQFKIFNTRSAPVHRYALGKIGTLRTEDAVGRRRDRKWFFQFRMKSACAWRFLPNSRTRPEEIWRCLENVSCLKQNTIINRLSQLFCQLEFKIYCLFMG